MTTRERGKWVAARWYGASIGTSGVRMAPRDEIHRRRDTVSRIAAGHGASNVRPFGSSW